MLYKNRDWLQIEYRRKRKTIEQIAKECGVGSTTILSWMKKFEIERRDHSGKTKHARYKNKKWLQREYWDKGKTIDQIAKKCNIGTSAVLYWMEKFGIEKRDVGGKPKFAKYKHKEWLQGEYWGKRKLMTQIAKVCRVSDSTILFWMKKLGAS